jgi:3-hydroxyacyl-[acyl-carrier-protein] dehydratase
MSLYDDLKIAELSVSKKNDQQVSAVFLFKKNLDVFKGHFPDNPILPGIFQIEMVKYALERAWGTRLSIQSVKKTKFSSIIQPDTEVCLAINIIDITIKQEQEIGPFTVKAILRTGEKVA